MWAYLERNFPQGIFITFDATDYISDFHSSYMMWCIISLMLLVEVFMLLKILVGDLNNLLKVIYLSLYSAGSLYETCFKASQHWIALFSQWLYSVLMGSCCRNSLKGIISSLQVLLAESASGLGSLWISFFLVKMTYPVNSPAVNLWNSLVLIVNTPGVGILEYLKIFPMENQVPYLEHYNLQ